MDLISRTEIKSWLKCTFNTQVSFPSNQNTSKCQKSWIPCCVKVHFNQRCNTWICLGCVKLLNISKPALYPDLLKTHCTIWPKQPLTIFNIQQLISKHFQFRINIMKMYKAELKIFYEACFLGNMQAEKLLRTWTLHEAQILIYNLTF